MFDDDDDGGSGDDTAADDEDEDDDTASADHDILMDGNDLVDILELLFCFHKGSWFCLRQHDELRCS